MYDGIQYGSRVDGTTQRKLHAKVVDNVLAAPVYFSRLISNGKPFMGKTEDVTVDIISDTQGQFFTGLETLNATAVNTTVTLSYARTAFQQPKVSVMMDSFANSGEYGIIPLDAFKYEKAAAETQQKLGAAIYLDGSADRPLGLGALVDDGTNVGTIGGQSRSTYSQLNATLTTSSGTLSLAKEATLFDTISASGLTSEEPNVGLASVTVWSLHEQLLQPSVRASYEAVGYDKVPHRSMQAVRGNAELAQGAGLTSISYRGIPILKDNFCTAGFLYFLNENYYDWKGASIVPEQYKDFMEKVNLGTMKAYEGTGAEALNMPSEYNGFFYQNDLMLPNQAGMIGRFYVIGQVVAKGFRRSGALYAITGV